MLLILIIITFCLFVFLEVVMSFKLTNEIVDAYNTLVYASVGLLGFSAIEKFKK